MCVLTSPVRKQALLTGLGFQSGTLPLHPPPHVDGCSPLWPYFPKITVPILACPCPPHCPVDALFTQFGVWFYHAGQAFTDPTWSPCLPLPELPHPTLGCLCTWTRSLPSSAVILMSLHGHSSQSTCVSASQAGRPVCECPYPARVLAPCARWLPLGGCLSHSLGFDIEFPGHPSARYTAACLCSDIPCQITPL